MMIPGITVTDKIIDGTEGDVDNTLVVKPYNEEEKAMMKELKKRSLIDRLFGTKAEKDGNKRAGDGITPRSQTGSATPADDPMRTRMASDGAGGGGRGGADRSVPMTDQI